MGAYKKCPHCVRLSYEPQTHHLWNTKKKKKQVLLASSWQKSIKRHPVPTVRPNSSNSVFFCSAFSGWVVAPLQSQQARCQPSETQQLGSLSKVASVRGRCVTHWPSLNINNDTSILSKLLTLARVQTVTANYDPKHKNLEISGVPWHSMSY